MMPIKHSEGIWADQAPIPGLDFSDPESREFLDHFLTLLALEYVERMRRTSDPEDLAAWEASAETTNPRRNHE